MKKSRSTESQIVSILKAADAGIPVNELWRKHGISSVTYHKWKARVRRPRCIVTEAHHGA